MIIPEAYRGSEELELALATYAAHDSLCDCVGCLELATTFDSDAIEMRCAIHSDEEE